MVITKEKKENFTLLKINSEKLDSTLSPNLKAEFVLLNKSGEKQFVVDLSEVKYCDSSGVSALLIGNRLCNEAEGKFVICNLNEMVNNLIQILQLNTILNISQTVTEAEELLA